MYELYLKPWMYYFSLSCLYLLFTYNYIQIYVYIYIYICIQWWGEPPQLSGGEEQQNEQGEGSSGRQRQERERERERERQRERTRKANIGPHATFINIYGVARHRYVFILWLWICIGLLAWFLVAENCCFRVSGVQRFLV